MSLSYEDKGMPKSIPTSTFVLVVVRSGDRFLLVQEAKHGQLWYIPAGRVEAGERLLAAARRETLEEAGIPIELEGILRIEHTPTAYGWARLRVIYLARPAGDHPLKSQPDDESLQARWVALEELNQYPLRGEEVAGMFEYIANGGPVYPLSLLTFEGAPW
jgi:phosphatase NudJ